MRWVVPLIAIALLGCSSEQPPPTVDGKPPTLVIHGARVFDGEKTLAASTVLLRNDRILAIRDEPPASEGVEVLHCEDCTLLPGLIDAHTHIDFERELQQALVLRCHDRARPLHVPTHRAADATQGGPRERKPVLVVRSYQRIETWPAAARQRERAPAFGTRSEESWLPID